MTRSLRWVTLVMELTSWGRNSLHQHLHLNPTASLCGAEWIKCGAQYTTPHWQTETWAFLSVFEETAVKNLDATASPATHRRRKHSLELAGQMCWCSLKETQLLGLQLSSLWKNRLNLTGSWRDDARARQNQSSWLLEYSKVGGGGEKILTD